MTTSLEIYSKYTLPAVGVLTLIARPFLGRPEMLNIVSVTVATMFVAPVEESLAFRVISTVLTLLWTFLCVRWTIPFEHFNHDERTYRRVRWIPIVALSAYVTLTAIGYRSTNAARPCCSRASSSVAAVAVAFAWYGAGNYFVKNLAPRSAAVLVPTVYLSWARHRTMATAAADDDDEPRLINWLVADFVNNVVVVLAATSFEKARGMMETYPVEFPRRYSCGWKYFEQMLRAFATCECSASSVVTEDVKKCVSVANASSSSTRASSYLYQAGVRLDMLILYSYCRVTDNIFDSVSHGYEYKKRAWNVNKRFVDELFADRKSDYDVKNEPCGGVDVDWTRYRCEFNDAEISCFRALSRIAFYLPRKPFYELLEGYERDIENKLIRNENDLMNYCNCVAGCIGKLCLYIMAYRSFGDREYDDLTSSEKFGHELDKAKKLSQALQLVNISRDIVADSEQVGRCYVPAEYMDDEPRELGILCGERNPRSLGNEKLKAYSNRLIELANRHHAESVDVVGSLAHELRGGILAGVNMYRGLVPIIRSYPTRKYYECAAVKASVPKSKKIMIVIKSLYVESVRYHL